MEERTEIGEDVEDRGLKKVERSKGKREEEMERKGIGEMA